MFPVDSLSLIRLQACAELLPMQACSTGTLRSVSDLTDPRIVAHVHISEPLILRRAPNKAPTGYFAGLASTYSVDRHGERMLPGAFKKTIAAFNAGTQHIALLHNHDAAQPIGAITSAVETEEGLSVEGTIVLGSPVADRDHQLLLAGAAGLSVGFAANNAVFERDAQDQVSYKSVDLMEVSVVAVPSNRESIAHVVRGLATLPPAELERMFRLGALPEMPGRLAKILTRACLDALSETDPDEPDPAELAAIETALAQLRTTFQR
jgi:HK97 family phage prohead protease